MQRLLIFCCLTIMACSPAGAIEVLHCTDTDAIGYQWKNGMPSATRYVPLSFVVKINGPTERIIDSPSRDYNDQKYRCSALENPPGTLACARMNSATGYPINFRDNRFERVGNLSAQIGGSPDLYVAYGQCEPF
ncbi:MAG: hypothetical protein HOK82_02305 [Rhodospirillaceae bacterium]|jgi:hypothetical protein|nr:hypothetical protein [Rhodospirillaceae bacterium]